MTRERARIRLAAPADAAAMLAIYAPIVRDTVISFELEPPTVMEMRERIEGVWPRWPWLVCESAGELLGYAYASQHRTRAAYQWSVDASVYVRADARRGGVARALYTSLFGILDLQGYRNAYAGITLPNAASVDFHEALGFEPVGVYRDVGYKLGAWRDVGWWARSLGEHGSDPSPPLELAALCDSTDWEKAIAAGETLLRR